ncbi:MAG: hypothetical protein ABSF23_00775 [Terracidiphilus sp.]|jgi:hypothetical protein
MSQIDAAADKLAASIPEVHYDLIARVLPGALTLIIIAAQATSLILPTYTKANSVTQSASPAFPSVQLGSGILFLVIAAALSWCLGSLLMPFGNLIQGMFFRWWIFRSFCRRNEPELKWAVECHLISPLPDISNWTNHRFLLWAGRACQQSHVTYQQLHDGLKEFSPGARTVLSKAQAELVFFEASAAGLLLVTIGCLLIVAYPASIDPTFEVPRLFCLLVYALDVPLLVLSIWGQSLKQKRLWLRHASFLNQFLDSNDRKSPLGRCPTSPRRNLAT